MNGNTLLMSDLTDNSFYPSAERIWLCIRLSNAGKYCGITFNDFGKKCKQAELSHFRHTYIEKPTHPKPVTRFGANFGPEA